MIGLGKFARTSNGRALRLAMLLMNSAADFIVCVRGSFRFAPAEKAPPASSPVRTAQRIVSSSSMAAKQRVMPSLKSVPHALRASGRLRVTIPISSRRSNETGMVGSCGVGWPPNCTSGIVAVHDPLAELVVSDHLGEPRALDLAAGGLRNRARPDEDDARRPMAKRLVDAARDLPDDFVVVVGCRVLAPHLDP